MLLPILLLSLAEASADWSARVTTRYGQNSKDGKSADGEMKEVSGRIFVRGPKVRLDVTSPAAMSIYYDQSSKASQALIHAAKIRLEGGFEEYRNRIPLCLPGQAEACFKKLGMKKVRTETVDGEVCTVYERKSAKAGKSGKKGDEDVDLTLWKPTRWKEVMALKSLVITKDGERVETRFHEISTRPLKAAEFVVPKGYVRAGGLERILKGLQGFSGN